MELNFGILLGSGDFTQWNLFLRWQCYTGMEQQSIRGSPERCASRQAYHKEQ